MTKYIGFIDAIAGTPNYDSAEESLTREMLFDHVAPGFKNELEVSNTIATQVDIATGGLQSRGRYFISSAIENLSIDAAASGQLRIDRIVVEFDFSVSPPTIDLKVSKGIEAASSPAANALIDTATKWEEPLALVNADQTGITSIDDDRIITGAIVGRRPYAQLERGTGNQTSGTNIEFQAAPKDDWGMWNAANPDRITAPEDGDYLVTWSFGFTQTVGSNWATATVSINAITEFFCRVLYQTNNAFWGGSAVFELSEDDYITFPSPLILDTSNYVRNLEVYVTVKKIR